MSKRMNLLNKLRQAFVLEAVESTDWSKGTKHPLIVELDTTEACDLACPGCISEDLMKTRNRFSDERLLRLGEEFHEQGVKGVILIGGGEPLAHPAVGKFMNYLGENDIHIGITTNGTFIDRWMDTISKYSNWTRVSMDAGTSELFNVLRPSKSGKSKFDKIVNNMRQLAKVKKGKLGFSFLIRSPADGPGIVSNIHEIYDAAELARDIGCDYFEVKPSYQYREEADHALVIHEKGLMEDAKKEYARLDTLVTDDFAILKAINLEYSFNAEQVLQPKEYTTCPVTELRTLICPSGVFVCPYWRGKEHMRIGDLNNTSLSDLWSGELRGKVVERLDPSKDCTFHCLRHESNLEILNSIRLMNSEDFPESIDEFDRFI
jgi:MoaA/NifB/PqqE/SkfB family radical SAM enzyme